LIQQSAQAWHFERDLSSSSFTPKLLPTCAAELFRIFRLITSRDDTSRHWSSISALQRAIEKRDVDQTIEVLDRIKDLRSEGEDSGAMDLDIAVYGCCKRLMQALRGCDAEDRSANGEMQLLFETAALLPYDQIRTATMRKRAEFALQGIGWEEPWDVAKFLLYLQSRKLEATVDYLEGGVESRRTGKIALDLVRYQPNLPLTPGLALFAVAAHVPRGARPGSYLLIPAHRVNRIEVLDLLGFS